MNENEKVYMKEAADNVILLDEAVFERIVSVLVEVLHGNKYPEERKKILGAIDYARQREMQEMQEAFIRQNMAVQQQKMWISNNTGSELQKTSNPYANTASTQNQLNYQQSRLEVERARAQLEAAQAAQSQLGPSKLNKFKFW